MQALASQTIASARVSLERWGVAAITAALVAPLVAVAGTVFRVPLAWGAIAALLVAVAATPQIARRLPVVLDGALRRHPFASTAWLLVGIAAVVRSAGVAWFMADPNHAQASAFWFDEFYIGHYCASAYWHAAQLAGNGVENLYDTALYANPIGRFRLDEYFYFPQFLILPKAAIALGADFQQMRAAWFVLDVIVVGGGMFALCRWIGGDVGRRAALLLPAVWLASPVLVTLQLGNFQLAAVVLSVVAMMLFERQRHATGGALLAMAGFKLFPGLLGVYLLAARRWRAAAWTIAFSLLYVLVAYLWMGEKPFLAFLHYQWPRMLSGEAWAFLEIEGLEAVTAINDSIPGMALKLKVLGVDGMTRAVAGGMAWVWTVLAVALTVLAARRAPQMSRLEQAAAWLAVLTIAAYRSPFVPDHNGLFAPLWLWSLIAAALLLTRRNVLWLTVAWVLLGLVLPFSGMPLPEVTSRLALSTSSQLLAVGLCLWVLLRKPSRLGEAMPIAAGDRASATAPLGAALAPR
jgi:hypothetical protein